MKSDCLTPLSPTPQVINPSSGVSLQNKCLTCEKNQTQVAQVSLLNPEVTSCYSCSWVALSSSASGQPLNRRVGTGLTGRGCSPNKTSLIKVIHSHLIPTLPTVTGRIPQPPKSSVIILGPSQENISWVLVSLSQRVAHTTFSNWNSGSPQEYVPLQPLKTWRPQEGPSRQSCHLFMHVQPSRECSTEPRTSTQRTLLYVITKEEKSVNYPSTLANVGTLSRSPSTPELFKECLGGQWLALLCQKLHFRALQVHLDEA